MTATAQSHWTEALIGAALRPGDRVLLAGDSGEPTGLADLVVACGFDVVRSDPAAGALTHLLWWDPTIRAVLMPSGPGAVSDEGDVRRALQLTGSDALLLVIPSRGA